MMATDRPCDGVMVRRLLSASPEDVFEAWTTPDSIAQWTWPEGIGVHSMSIDLRIGGKFRLVMSEQGLDVGAHGRVSGD